MTTSVGETLRKAREIKAITLEEAAIQMVIRQRYLEALENNDLDALPSRTQARGFLRTYANYLGLDSVQLLQHLDQPTKLSAPAEQTPSVSPTPTPDSEDTPAETFASIGRQLKERRDALSLSLDSVEGQTHIRAHYLKALEAGNFDELPSPIQGRGMLKNYAEFLSLDTDDLLLQYADGLQAQLSERRGVSPRAGQSPRAAALPPLWRRMLSGDLLFVTLIIVGMLSVLIWGLIRIGAEQNAARGILTATVPAIADVLIPSETPTPTATTTLTPAPLTPSATIDPNLPTSTPGDPPTEAPTPTPELVFPAAGSDSVQLYIIVLQRAYMRVQIDGEIVYDGRVAPGAAFQYSGAEAIEVLTGNGAALQVFYNQRDLGTLGILGQVVNRIFTPAGVLEPTATVTFTPQASPTGQPPPTATPTPDVTVTP